VHLHISKSLWVPSNYVDGSCLSSLHNYYLDAYKAERTPLLKERRPPAFSFGLRTKTSIKDENPSPNAYMLPSLLGTNIVGKTSQPAYSMTGRSKNGGFDEDLQKVRLCDMSCQGCLVILLINRYYLHTELGSLV